VHAPLTHVWFEHAAAVLHVPFAWHDSTPLPEHVVCPGPHTPVHEPLTHVWFEQAVAFCHSPVEPHVCGCEPPLHCV
jgi:hypothetical protein